MIRQHRWPEGVRCPQTPVPLLHEVSWRRHRYQCNHCHRRFDDLSLSVFSGDHQPLQVWVHCLSLMSLNLSNLQISKELGLHQSDVQKMTEQLRQAEHNKKPKNHLEGEVECDEVYLVAGHNGQPDKIKGSRKGRRNRLKGARGRHRCQR